MHQTARILLVALVCVALPSVAAAQGVRASGDARFTAAERETIARYFSEHAYEFERLPPGIVRRLERGKALPPGIAKRQPPAPLLELLPPRQDEDGAKLEVTIFGDRVVLLDASGLVVDVLEGIFGG